jgi:hypothetical protein
MGVVDNILQRWLASRLLDQLRDVELGKDILVDRGFGADGADVEIFPCNSKFPVLASGGLVSLSEGDHLGLHGPFRIIDAMIVDSRLAVDGLGPAVGVHGGIVAGSRPKPWNDVVAIDDMFGG